MNQVEWQTWWPTKLTAEDDRALLWGRGRALAVKEKTYTHRCFEATIMPLPSKHATSNDIKPNQIKSIHPSINQSINSVSTDMARMKEWRNEVMGEWMSEWIHAGISHWWIQTNIKRIRNLCIQQMDDAQQCWPLRHMSRSARPFSSLVLPCPASVKRIESKQRKLVASKEEIWELGGQSFGHHEISLSQPEHTQRMGWESVG